MGLRSPRTRHRCVPFPDHRDRFGQRLGLYQRAPARLLPRTPDHLHPFRPGNKNDGAHVEQKNWARVRELVGYLRYDTTAELEKHNEIWDLDRVFTNYLLPQQKLLEKHRHGAKVTKKHDTPALPHQRAIRHPAMRKRPIIGMNAAFKRIKPGAFSRQILALTAQLETLSRAKQPAAVKTVNRAWNS